MTAIFLYTFHYSIFTACCNDIALVSFAQGVIIVFYIVTYLIYVSICLTNRTKVLEQLICFLGVDFN